MNESASNLEQITSRAQSLYSRPTVAMEVVRLTEQPRVDAEKLKRCVEQDPALACKILRVVNSSIYGLNRPVTDLNQAIGLLGIKPLKLLVLGFNLPDALFAEVAARELRWYWTNTLTRAVAARSISEQLWRQPGDEAFTAGLLQEIGILVLMHELGPPYVRFLAGAVEERQHLAALEQDTLGFDHTQLSAALLARWQLPQRLVEAIATPKRQSRLARMSPPDGDLPQILHLADLLVQLVGQQRLRVLSELLEAGKVYRGLTKQKLTAIVEGLQPQVDQLAEVLSLELSDERDYVQMLLSAHQRMASLSEDFAGSMPADSADDRAHAQLLANTQELTRAMRAFLSGGNAACEPAARQWGTGHAAHLQADGNARSRNSESGKEVTMAALYRALLAAANSCRERRRELSLMLVEPNLVDAPGDGDAQVARQQIRMALLEACSACDPSDIGLLSLGKERIAAILSNCDRSAAVAMAQDTIAILARSSTVAAGSICDVTTTISVGVATAGVVPRNFDPMRIVECAQRCLSAAHVCGISNVKSIEV
jgi:HD-like signal output (HDOD) protein